jgi:hypothetical protein
MFVRFTDVVVDVLQGLNILIVSFVEFGTQHAKRMNNIIFTFVDYFRMPFFLRYFK